MQAMFLNFASKDVFGHGRKCVTQLKEYRNVWFIIQYLDFVSGTLWCKQPNSMLPFTELEGESDHL